MDKEYALKIVLANAICCSHSQEITCEMCPLYDKNIAANEDNTDPCRDSLKLDEKIVEAIKVLSR